MVRLVVSACVLRGRLKKVVKEKVTLEKILATRMNLLPTPGKNPTGAQAYKALKIWQWPKTTKSYGLMMLPIHSKDGQKPNLINVIIIPI